jgi:hypothetical protein
MATREDLTAAARQRNRKQIEFPPLQTHSRAFEAVMVGLSILCVVIVLVIVLGTDIGTLTRPTI